MIKTILSSVKECLNQLISVSYVPDTIMLLLHENVVHFNYRIIEYGIHMMQLITKNAEQVFIKCRTWIKLKQGCLQFSILLL